MGRGPLIKPRWIESGQWHGASCSPGTTGNTETKYVAEQHPKETSKMPRGISEAARVSTETPALTNISLMLQHGEPCCKESSGLLHYREAWQSHEKQRLLENG